MPTLRDDRLSSRTERIVRGEASSSEASNANSWARTAYGKAASESGTWPSPPMCHAAAVPGVRRDLDDVLVAEGAAKLVGDVLVITPW